MENGRFGSRVGVVYPDLSWFEPDGFNLFEKEAVCWSEQLRFSSWTLSWRSNKLKCLNLAWQAQRFWRWTILQISIKNYWENQWEKNQPISSDLQSSFRFLFPQWELWPLQGQPGGSVWKSSQFFWLGQLHALSQALDCCYLKRNLSLYGSLVGKSYRQYPQTWCHQVKQSKGLVERLKNTVSTFAAPQTTTAVTIWSVFPSKRSLFCSL